MVRAYYCAPYPKQLCVEHEANMYCLCYMMLLVLESSTKFVKIVDSGLYFTFSFHFYFTFHFFFYF